MKIIKLTVENIKKVKAAEVVPTGHVIKISGKNEQGKSSVLDSIMYGFCGKNAIDKEPLRRGAEEGDIQMDIGESVDCIDYRITRHVNDKGNTYLKVTSDVGKDGRCAEFRSPQELLSRLYSDHTFAPDEFAKMDAKDQRDTLLKIVEFDFDIADLTKIHPLPDDFEGQVPKEGLDPLQVITILLKSVEEKRREAKREVKSRKGLIEAIQIPEGMEDVKPVSVSDLFEEKEGLQKQATAQVSTSKTLEEVNLSIVGCESSESDLGDEIENLRAEVRRIEQAIEGKETGIILNASKKKGLTEQEKSIKEEIKTFPDLSQSFIEVENKIKSADETNCVAGEVKKKRELLSEMKEYQDSAEKSDDAINKINRFKQDLVASANFPIEGLGFGDDCVTFDGVPIEQAGSSKQMIIGMNISAALNPDLRIILIKNGNEFDEDSEKLIEEWAEEHDYQIWMHCVENSSEGVEFWIEDGNLPPKEEFPAEVVGDDKEIAEVEGDVNVHENS